MLRVLPARSASLSIFAIALVMLWPAFSQVHLPRAQWALQRLESGVDHEAGLLTPTESEIRFAMSVRQATPETSGFLDRRLTPEYGLLVDPTFGHTFVYAARRPVPANNFGPYLDREKFDDATRFYTEADATVAIEALERLAPRFVVTAASAFLPPMPYAQQLHRGDGFHRGEPVCGPCFRLVTEGPERGTPSRSMLSVRTRWSFVPYKLFERVAGARIEIAASPGSRVLIHWAEVLKTCELFTDSEGLTCRRFQSQ